MTNDPGIVVSFPWEIKELLYREQSKEGESPTTNKELTFNFAQSVAGSYSSCFCCFVLFCLGRRERILA
jgi:hypothetical protein